MKKIIVLLLAMIMLIFCLDSVIAPCSENQKNCINGADYDNLEKPTAKDFNQLSLEERTAARLQKIKNPTSQQINSLKNAEERKNYFRDLDYSKPENRKIAHNYFTSVISNVNNNPGAFRTYLENFFGKGKGIDVIGEITGSLGGFSKDGTLNSKIKSINLNDFKPGGLKDKYAIAIVNGDIRLIDKKTRQTIEFTGQLINDGTGNIGINGIGSINGVKLKDGSSISVDKDGVISGEAKETNGVVFKKISAFKFDNKLKILTLDRVEIESVDAGAEMFLRGSVIIKEYGNIKGKLSALKNDKLLINNFDVITGNENAELRFKKGKTDEEVISKEKKPYVEFSESIVVNGEVKVKVNELGVRENKNNANKLSRSILNTPNINGRGWFRKGDEFKEGTENFDVLVDIKRVLNAWHEDQFNGPLLSEEEMSNGKYGDAAFELVKKFQEQYNRLNPGDNIKLDGAWGKQTLEKFKQTISMPKLDSKNFVVDSKKGGKTIVSYSNGKIGIDTSGDVGFVVGNKKFSNKNGDVYKQIGKSLATVMGSDVTINFRTEGGDIIDTIKAKPNDFSSNNLGGDFCIGCAVAKKMEMDKPRCAEYIQNIIGIPAVGSENAEEFAAKLGFTGPTWRMAHNIVGETVYKREDELSGEDRRTLFEVEMAIRQRFDEMQSEGIDNLKIRERLRSDDISGLLPPDLKEKYGGQSLQQIHDGILLKKASYDIRNFEEGDYISLYHGGSKFSGTASLNGKTVPNDEKLRTGKVYGVEESMQNNRATHSASGYWGDSQDIIYDYSKNPQQTLSAFLMQTYGLKKVDSVGMLGNIFVEDVSGLLEEARLATDGQVYFSSDLDANGEPLQGRERIVMRDDTKIEVQPYMVHHLDGRAYNEPLAKAIDTKNSVYLIKRPDQKLREQTLKEFGITPDMENLQIREGETVTTALRRHGVPEAELPTAASVVARANKMNVGEPREGDVLKIPSKTVITSPQLTLKSALRSSGISNPDEWAGAISTSAADRLTESGIDPIHRRDLELLTAGILKRESNFGESNRARLKSLFDLLPDSANPFVSRGPAQIKVDTARGIAESFGENFDSDDLKTKEGSVKYAQRLLSQAIQYYSTPGQPLSQSQREMIAVTYNSGLLSPRNTALQSQLIDLGYISPGTQTTGNVGPATIEGLTRLARDESISLPPGGIPAVMGVSKKSQFENGKLYLRLKERWQNKMGKEAEYAAFPQYATERMHTGQITSKGYAEAVAGYARLVTSYGVY